jgi:hypothetical protein
MLSSVNTPPSVAVQKRPVARTGLNVELSDTLLRDDQDASVHVPLGDVGGKHDIKTSVRLALLYD